MAQKYPLPSPYFPPPTNSFFFLSSFLPPDVTFQRPLPLPLPSPTTSPLADTLTHPRQPPSPTVVVFGPCRHPRPSLTQLSSPTTDGEHPLPPTPKPCWNLAGIEVEWRIWVRRDSKSSGLEKKKRIWVRRAPNYLDDDEAPNHPDEF